MLLKPRQFIGYNGFWCFYFQPYIQLSIFFSLSRYSNKTMKRNAKDKIQKTNDFYNGDVYNFTRSLC